MSEDLSGIIEALDDMIADTTVSQNIRSKLTVITSELKTEAEDVTLKVNKVLDDLEQISNDSNLPSYTRTQLWNISCMLEMI